jgi:hypothetical protein
MTGSRKSNKKGLEEAFITKGGRVTKPTSLRREAASPLPQLKSRQRKASQSGAGQIAADLVQISANNNVIGNNQGDRGNGIQWKEGDSVKRKDLSHFKIGSRNQRRTANKLQNWADRQFDLLKQAVESEWREEFDALLGEHLLDTPIGGIVLPREEMEGEIQAEAEDSQNIDETNIIYENIRI